MTARTFVVALVAMATSAGLGGCRGRSASPSQGAEPSAGRIAPAGPEEIASECGGERLDAPANATASVAPAPDGPAREGREASTACFALECGRVLPEPLRARFAAGPALVADAVADGEATCRFALPNAMSAAIHYDCAHRRDAAFLAQMRPHVERPKSRVEDVSIGQGGWVVTLFGAHTVGFLDGDTGCLVTVTAPGEKKRVLELARAVEQSLTPASVR